MDDITHVRKRIKNRRFKEEQGERKKKAHHPIFSLFYHFIMLFMGVCMIFLAVLVNQKLNLVQMPAVLQNFKVDDIAHWLPFENWFSLKEQAVSSTPTYSLLKGNQYANGSNEAYNAYDAIILHVQSQPNGKTSVSVKQDNGVIATYGNLQDVSVKQDERIVKGKPLGMYESYVTIDFLKNNKAIDLNAALQSNPH